MQLQHDKNYKQITKEVYNPYDKYVYKASLMLPVMRFLAGIDSIKDFGGRDGASLTDFWGL